MDRKAALVTDRRNFLSKVFNRVAEYQIPKDKKIKIIKINLFTYNEWKIISSVVPISARSDVA